MTPTNRTFKHWTIAYSIDKGIAKLDIPWYNIIDYYYQVNVVASYTLLQVLVHRFSGPSIFIKFIKYSS